MPNQVFKAGLETGGSRKAGRRSEDGDKKSDKKGNGDTEGGKKRTRTQGGRRKTRSDTQH